MAFIEYTPDLVADKSAKEAQDWSSRRTALVVVGVSAGLWSLMILALVRFL